MFKQKGKGLMDLIAEKPPGQLQATAERSGEGGNAREYNAAIERPIHVVAIDDEPSAIAVLEAGCAIAGFKLSTTNDPHEGHQLIRELEPDVVLLDVMMPGLNGFDLCKAIKSDPQTQLIPVVLVTALDSRNDRLQGIEAGCDDFVTKPIDRLELTARVRSLARVRRLTADLDDAEQILGSIAKNVEIKDGNTAEHCERLTRFGMAFGQYLDLSAPDVKALSRAGLLHDIGKVGIPDGILLKRGKLDEAEFKIMKTHAALGAELLAPLRSMQRVVPIVRHHHEAWGGGGYPDGLCGSDIPLLARIFTVLDIYDALTMERPYKPAFSREKSLEIMTTECAEGKTDPELFEKFKAFLADYNGD
jgi:putative two-component system response regulator